MSRALERATLRPFSQGRLKENPRGLESPFYKKKDILYIVYLYQTNLNLKGKNNKKSKQKSYKIRTHNRAEGAPGVWIPFKLIRENFLLRSPSPILAPSSLTLAPSPCVMEFKNFWVGPAVWKGVLRFAYLFPFFDWCTENPIQITPVLINSCFPQNLHPKTAHPPFCFQGGFFGIFPEDVFGSPSPYGPLGRKYPGFPRHWGYGIFFPDLGLLSPDFDATKVKPLLVALFLAARFHLPPLGGERGFGAP